MRVLIDLKNIGGEIAAISSKSDAHRMLIAAALADEETKLILNSTSEDIKATCKCLEALGAKIKNEGTNLIVSPIKAAPCHGVLDCNESGSTIRFLMPVAAALGVSSVFTGGGRLPERPQTPLLNALKEHNIITSPDGEFPIKLEGKLKGGVFTIPGNISSQYVTGLLFALPLLSEDSEIRLIPPVESRPYINMTISTLKRFGIDVTSEGDSYFIRGNQKYISPKEAIIDGDWSNGALFVALGAINKLKIYGLFKNSLQGDKAIAEIVKSMGAVITQNESDILICPNKLHGVSIDVGNTPDLVPVISALSALSEGETKIYNAARLRIKESDRLSEMANILKSAGVTVIEEYDSLTIKGTGTIKDEIFVDAKNDHRLVMAAAVLATKSKVTIENAQAINKSYPKLFDDLKSLGGVVNVLNDR